MANPNAPDGVQAVSGGAVGEKIPVNEYTFAESSAAFGVGQPMSKAEGNVCSPAATGNLVGTVVSISWVDSDGVPHKDNYWPGAQTGTSDRVLSIADDPNQLFEVQCDGEFENADLGKNANFTARSVDSAKKISTVALDISTAATTASLPAKIMRVVKGPRDGAEVGDYTRVLVKINNHINNQTTGV